jgi:hypothetical protein
MKKIVYLLLASFCWACSAPQSNEQDKNNRLPKDDLKVLEGNWIMSNYLDSIKKYKAIERFTSGPLTFTAIMLRVKQDSLYSYGLLQSHKNGKLFHKYDSLTTMQNWHDYQLSYDKSQNQLRAVFVKGRQGAKDSIQYIFRRFTEDEKELVKGIERDRGYPRASFEQFFIDKLMSGKYTPLGNKFQPTMVLDTTGKVKGFKQYNKYHIHSYFGTLHPYRPEDAIIFEDTTAVRKSLRPPSNIGIYSWEFRQDTLVLTEMLTKTYEQWHKGTKVFKFIKQ